MASPTSEQPDQTELPFVRLFTDGACSGNPGPGGWAYILKHPQSGKVTEASGGQPETTNNQMELMAAICGLEALKRPCKVELVSDSKYVGQGIEQWMPNWKKNNWRRRKGKSWTSVKNEELWRRLDAALVPHQVNIVWVAGHQGHEENERCDELAVAAYQQYL
ncbi:Ribonuclease H [Planctomycetales bacterium 10988]|nr:Ribonuclease H [Planctomycetales bacterium 10988]